MKRILTKIVDVKPDEIRALWLGFVFNFMVLGGYYVIRPIRDEIGAIERRGKSAVDVHGHVSRHADR